jgi:putative flippase GtrA
VVRLWVFRAKFWRAEPFRTVRCCSCFRSACLGSAIVRSAVFSINIERRGFIVRRWGVIACCG